MAKLGRLMLVKVGDGGSVEVFVPNCGINSTTLGINNSEIDVTLPNCTDPGGKLWTETLAGVSNVSLSGDGLFVDTAQMTRLNSVALAGDNLVNLEIVVPDFGTYSGAFRVSTLEFSGDAEGSLKFSTSLTSNGPVTFTAA